MTPKSRPLDLSNMRLLVFLVLAHVAVHTVFAVRGALFRSRRADPSAWAGREDFLRFGRALSSSEGTDKMEDLRGKRFFTDFYADTDDNTEYY
ncbi:hypothetical protein PRIPAC_89018 [Pristionchus pacificus]|uniref:Uncharacterized protein n=1 Tax=Pristionchus pacificus TaxID=54126 RepID=A0A2A6CTQ3_PRIPA|nr:hypothetical protein PRIPAC_89018 [Pristionchus pacificus]|eukprot:PDM81466.1 hypothetical protein PRIPAC_35342 [Pristionchus pacificus]